MKRSDIATFSDKGRGKIVIMAKRLPSPLYLTFLYHLLVLKEKVDDIKTPNKGRGKRVIMVRE